MIMRKETTTRKASIDIVLSYPYATRELCLRSGESGENGAGMIGKPFGGVGFSSPAVTKNRTSQPQRAALASVLLSDGADTQELLSVHVPRFFG